MSEMLDFGLAAALTIRPVQTDGIKRAMGGKFSTMPWPLDVAGIPVPLTPKGEFPQRKQVSLIAA